MDVVAGYETMNGWYEGWLLWPFFEFSRAVIILILQRWQFFSNFKIYLSRFYIPFFTKDVLIENWGWNCLYSLKQLIWWTPTVQHIRIHLITFFVYRSCMGGGHYHMIYLKIYKYICPSPNGNVCLWIIRSIPHVFGRRGDYCNLKCSVIYV